MKERMQIRKLIKLKQVIIAITLTMLFISCQKDYVEIVEPDKSTAISANDNIADLIRKVALKDGSFDNIIDKCSEISINYPYSLTIKDERIEINSQEDLDTVILEYFQFREAIRINYPITVSYSDYSEAVLSNTGELRRIQDQFNARKGDEDIECVDFKYPIDISLYNTRFQKSEAAVARNDKEMHRLFRDIKDLIVELAYPIVIETQKGNTISINNNYELEIEIENAIGSCDEEDDVEFSDEDYPYALLLMEKEWRVQGYRDSTNQTDRFTAYVFDFSEDDVVQVNTDTGTFYGTWELNSSDEQKRLKLEFDTDETPITWLNHEWLIKNSSFNNIEMESDTKGTKRKFALSSDT